MIRVGLMLLALALLSAVAPAQSIRPRHVTPEAEQAIQEGLKWLAGQQDPVSGAYGSRAEFSQNVGVTALAGLAFLASGSTPESGPYQQQLEQITSYLLASAAPNGFIIEENAQNQGPMYGHGFAVMYLAEVYGMTEHPEVREKLKRGVELIISCQNKEGGWRYFPKPEEADLSVTACQVMALRSARNAGIATSKEVIDRAVSYIRRCQTNDGGFRYRVSDAAESRLPRSAAAVVALYASGVHEGPVIDEGLAYLERYVPGPRTPRDPQYYFYTQYYAAQAAWHAGGDTWNRWYPAARDELLRLQVAGKGWRDPWIGDDYATAMALIALQIPYDYVPILQR